MANSLVDVVREGMAPDPADEENEMRIELLPPLSGSEIDALERDLPCPLPADVRELLTFCGGVGGGAAEVDFARLGFEMPALLPHGHPIATDGLGNFWVVDLFPSSRRWAPIYFVCHDPPVFLLQSPSLKHFLRHNATRDAPLRPRLFDEVHADRVFDVWRTNPGAKSQAACLASADAELRAFAEQLDDSFHVVDMREAEVGFGFSWGRYGPETRLRRAGQRRIFAYAEPRRDEGRGGSGLRGMLGRLLGRGP